MVTKKQATFARPEVFDALSKKHDFSVKMKLKTSPNNCATKTYKKVNFLRSDVESPKGAFLACPTGRYRF